MEKKILKSRPQLTNIRVTYRKTISINYNSVSFEVGGDYDTNGMSLESALELIRPDVMRLVDVSVAEASRELTGVSDEDVFK